MRRFPINCYGFVVDQKEEPAVFPAEDVLIALITMAQCLLEDNAFLNINKAFVYLSQDDWQTAREEIG